MYYIILKTIHIINSTILFGTGIGTAFFMLRAHQSKNVEGMYVIARNVVLADFIFTTPAVIIQPITGYLLMQQMGFSFATPWIKWSLYLYAVAGACWLPVVWLQIQMRNMIKQALEQSTPISRHYHIFYRIWFSLGWPAFSSLMVTYYLMVGKHVGT